MEMGHVWASLREDAGGDDDEQGLEMSERGINGEEEEGEEVALISGAQIIMPRHTEQIDAVILREDEKEIAAASRALFDKDWPQRLRFIAKELRYTLIGGFFALSGLAAFLSQSRDNYFLAHSAWHVTVMASTYFFVAGRAAAICNAKGLVHRLLNDDA